LPQKSVILLFKTKVFKDMSNLLLFMSLGPSEIFVILLVVLLLFGGKKIPELARGIGKGIREFNAAKSSVKSEIEDGMRTDNTSNSKED
tara:strand:+ start:256 stop:522 length:267 start_codon:yes stop_codon:yes gene_type:complete